MSARARRSTDEVVPGLSDPERQRARQGTPAPVAGPAAPRLEPVAHEATEVMPFPMRSPVEQPPPTRSDPRPVEQGGPAALPRGAQPNAPIRVISMKDQADAARPRIDAPRVPPQVQLRSLAEVSGRNDTPLCLGYLAPPYDPRQARARRVRDHLMWGCVAVGLACAISLAIWLVAGG